MDHFGIRYSRQHEAVTDNPSIRIYINKIEDIITIKIKRGHSKRMFAQDSWVLTPSPLVCPCSFLGTPSPPCKVCLFWLKLTLSPSISLLIRFREKKLIVSASIFGWNTPLHWYSANQKRLQIDIFYITHIGDLVWVYKSNCTPFINRTWYYNLSWWFF